MHHPRQHILPAPLSALIGKQMARRHFRSLSRRIYGYGRHWHRHQGGATTMEWAMLLMAIGIPAATISFAVLRLLGHYSKMTLTLTNLPFP